MDQRFLNKTAIVTGASRGIGRAIAARLGAEGARVVATARDQPLLESLAQEIQTSGGSAEIVAADLRLPESAKQVVDHAVSRFGRIDLVVNNAGATRRGEFLELQDADFADGFALKYFAAVRLTQLAWPHLRASKGAVIFISGQGGRTPGAHFTIGGSVNAALLSLTKALADLGIRDGVQVNAINPGTIRTGRFAARLNSFAKEHGLTPESAEPAYLAANSIARIGEPSDIAALVAFVGSAEGRLFHGSLIDMDAGATKTI